MPHAILRKVAASLSLKEGFVDDARRQATPHVVECFGLSREWLGDERFESELRARVGWCRRNCIGEYEIEPIRDKGRLVGRRFRFGEEADADQFRVLFYTDFSWMIPML